MEVSRFKAAAGILLLAFLSGCGLKARYEGPAVYKPLGAPKKALGPYALAVFPLQDKRGRRADLSSRWLLSWIPLVFYAGVVQDRPENPARDIQALWRRGAPEDPDTYARFSQGYPAQFSPGSFLQQGLVKELEHSRLFERVYAADSAAGASQADLWLKGTLESTRLAVSNISYGILDLGLYFNFFLAAPSGSTRQELVLNLELVNPATGEAVWRGKISEKGKGLGSLWWYLTGFSRYSPPPLGPGPKNHNGQPLYELLARGMDKALPGMEASLRPQPSSFWEGIRARKAQMPPSPEPPAQDPEPEDPLQRDLEKIKKDLLQEE